MISTDPDISSLLFRTSRRRPLNSLLIAMWWIHLSISWNSTDLTASSIIEQYAIIYEVMQAIQSHTPLSILVMVPKAVSVIDFSRKVLSEPTLIFTSSVMIAISPLGIVWRQRVTRSLSLLFSHPGLNSSMAIYSCGLDYARQWCEIQFLWLIWKDQQKQELTERWRQSLRGSAL